MKLFSFLRRTRAHQHPQPQRMVALRCPLAARWQGPKAVQMLRRVRVVTQRLSGGKTRSVPVFVKATKAKTPTSRVLWSEVEVELMQRLAA